MNGTILGYGFVLLTALTACAPTATPGRGRTSGSNAVNYNGYNDDLAAARPSYDAPKATVPVSLPPPTGSKPEAAVTPPPKPKPVTLPERNPTDRASDDALLVNKRLDAVLDTIAQKNRAVRYASGYRIQVYVGNEREDADAARLQVYRLFPELSPYLSYKEPTYRLKVGDFMRRLDADWYLSQLKQQFKSISLQPDKVDIRRSLLIK